MVRTLPANAGDMGLIPDPRRSHMLWNDKVLCASTMESMF